MPAVNPKKLQRLMIAELLVPFAMKRRLSGAQLADLVQRAVADKRFDLSASSDEFAGLMTESEAEDWAIEFERGGSAPHLFSGDADDESTTEEMYGGVKKSEFLKMAPEQRLAIANRVADQERRNAKKH